MKFKAILVVFALTFSSMANAALTLDGNVGFTMLNSAGDQSWILDLGKPASSFIDQTVGAFEVNVLDELGLKGTIEGYAWGVMGGVTANPFGYLVTVQDANIPKDGRSNVQIGTGVFNIGGYFDNNANKSGASMDGDSGFYNGPNNFQGDCAQGCDPDGQNQAFVDSKSPSMMPFYFNQATPDDGVTSILGTFSLSYDGTLTYAPVPVPAAVWMFGSVIAGMYGFARRRKSQSFK